MRELLGKVVKPFGKVVKAVRSLHMSHRGSDGCGNSGTGYPEPRKSKASACGQPNSRIGKSPQYKARDVADLRRDYDDLKRRLDESKRELKQVQQALEESSEKLKKTISENSRLTTVNQTLENQMSDLKSDMEEKIKRARNLEESSPALLDWIQSMMGYADNKELFPSDADELAQFRADAKRLPILLRLNKIECNNTPPDEGVGFVHKRDPRITEGREVLAAPMLLRNGVIISEGIVLVPDVSEQPQRIPNVGSEQRHTEVCHTESLNTRSDTQPPKASADMPQTPVLFTGEQLRDLEAGVKQSQDIIAASVSPTPVPADVQIPKVDNCSGLDSVPSSVLTSDSTYNNYVDAPFPVETPVVDIPAQANLSDGRSALELAVENEQSQGVSKCRTTESLTCVQTPKTLRSVPSGSSASSQTDEGQQSPLEFDI